MNDLRDISYFIEENRDKQFYCALQPSTASFILRASALYRELHPARFSRLPRASSCALQPPTASFILRASARFPQGK
jgi:hypothetical protein